MSTLTHPAARAAPRRAARALILGLAAFGLTLVALILLFYTLPGDYDSFYFPLNPRGVEQFRAHLGLARLPHLDFRVYSRAFRLLLILLWCCYALAVAICLRGVRPAFRPLLVAAALAAAVAAFLEPPLLSTDIYANVSHGRIFALYGQNPYLWRPSGLLAFHDPVTRFLSWDWPTIYGPVWTWIEIGIAALLRPFGLWTQVVAHKLLLGGALLVVALAARRLAARFSPGRENLTFLAVGLNPMLLLEGPGSGHNDLVFLSFLLVGAVLYFEKKYIPALLCLGLSVGIKPFTLALLPWALLEYSRGRTWRQALTATAVASALVLLPLALAFAPLWGGAATLAPMQQRAVYGQSAAVVARSLHFHAWLGAHGVRPLAASVLVSLSQNWLLAVLYLVLSVLLWRGRVAGGWLTAWALFSAALMFLLIVPVFPWYVAWFWPFCLLRWDRWHLGLSAACLVLSLVWTMGYGMVTYSSTIGTHCWINMDGTESVQPKP